MRIPKPGCHIAVAILSGIATASLVLFVSVSLVAWRLLLKVSSLKADIVSLEKYQEEAQAVHGKLLTDYNILKEKGEQNGNH